jgi:hypothetical protein
MWRNQDGRSKFASGSGSSWSELDLAALEGEVFLIGNYKNYEELEDSLSMPELIQTFKSMQKSESEKRKFLAAIQGVELDSAEEEQSKSFEDVRRRALGITADASDVVSLQGQFASEAGFGIGAGLGYKKE